MAQRLKTDWILFITVVVMAAFGLLMLYSASSIMAELKYNSSWHFVGRQFAWAVLGTMAMMAAKKTNYRQYRNSKVAFVAIGIALLLLIVVYFVDAKHHRWLRLGGPFGVQPSELAKPALVVFLAFFVTWRARAINTRPTLVPAALSVGLVVFWVVVADLGTAVVLGVTSAVVFFVAGLELRYCAIVAGIAVAGVIVFVVLEPYRFARVVQFFDPELRIVSRLGLQERVKAHIQKSRTSRDTSYHVNMSKIAVGAGGPLGLGLMQGKQKLYVPAPHTDFIYAVACEEMGLAGSVGLLSGFLIVFWRGLRATVRMRDDFGRYLALGVCTMLVVQGFMNMSVVLGMMPTKGIPLPMISSGGSSLLSTLLSLGILMNVSEHAG